MQTSLALARAQLRHRWRNLAGTVVLVGLIGEITFDDLFSTPFRAGSRHQPAMVMHSE